LPLIKKILSLSIIYLALISIVRGQDFSNTKTIVDTFRISLDNSYQLTQPAVFPQTIKIELNSIFLSNSDFKFIPDSNSIVLSRDVDYHLFDSLFVTYKYLPLPIRRTYRKNKLVTRWDDKFKQKIREAAKENINLSSESIFGKGLRKSGTILRGITVGTNSGTKLNSGLRLELSGKLTKDIELVAALSDQNTPIQPEGVTERLNEVDKVFIEMRHKLGTATFGDYYLNKKSGMFSSVNRKLQGLQAEIHTEKYNGFSAFASQRGKFTSNKFNGIDGVQGPYRLYGINNERDIIVIAGTEIVYVDGIKMRRGESNDYTIDYSNGTVVFKAQRLITGASRIFIEFQYTDRKFERTFWAAGGSANLLNDKLQISASYFNENDDEKNPVDFTFTDEEKRILSNAGSNPLKAVISGVKLAPTDSTGARNGVYAKIDTMISGNDYSYYVYEPGNPNAIYFVTFSYVGENKGDYSMVSLAEYKFVGREKGGYLPVKFLPLPQKKQLADFNFNYSPKSWINFNGEIAGSMFDKNKFSSDSKSSINGYARNFAINIKRNKTSLFGYDFGKFQLSYSDRFIQDKFSPLERVDNVEFNRNYNITTEAGGNQTKREVGFKFNPNHYISLFGNYGLLKYSDNFTSNRYYYGLSVGDIHKYQLNFTNNFVSSNTVYGSDTFLDQKGDAFYKLWKFKAGFTFERDKKDSYLNSADSLINQSHDYWEVAPYFESSEIIGIRATYKYKIRKESEPLDNILTDKSTSQIHQLNFNLRGFKHFSSNLSLALQNKNYTSIWKRHGLTDNQSILIRSISRINFFNNFFRGDLLYNAATEKSAKLQRIFVPVPVGTGNYIYLGDINNNGVADENEFRQTNIDGNFIASNIPTDKLFSVINLQLSSRIKFDFAKLFKYKSIWKTFVAPISGETFYRVDEKSKIADTKKIYFLNRNYFMNDSTTMNGSEQFQQDIYLFRFSPDFSLRGRFLQKRYLKQYSSGIVKNFKLEKSLRLRTRLVKEIRWQIEYHLTDDNLLSGAGFSQSHISNTEELNSDFSYRPVSNIEVGFNFGAGKTTDVLPKVPTDINFNSQLIRIDFSFVGKGRIRFEAERKELLSNVEDYKIPWEITRGNRIGKNYTIRLNVNYKISGNLQSTLAYTGIKYGASNFIHTMRAEARAYF